MRDQCRRKLLQTLFVFCLMLGGLSIAACAVTYRGFTFVEWWHESRSGLVLWHGNTRARYVALTFDDGPDPRYTPRVLAILRRYHVHATFFEIGRRVEKSPRLARRVIAEGHVIGNHSYSHSHLNHLSRRNVVVEMSHCETCLEKALHLRCHLFRPPRGEWTPAIFRESRHEKDHMILWSVAVEHQDAPTPRAMARRALNLIRPGGILLMHDGSDGLRGRERTIQALPLILEGLRARGYRCVTVPELLHIQGDEPLPPSSENSRPIS